MADEVVAEVAQENPSTDDEIMGRMAATYLYQLGLAEKGGLQLPSEKVDALLARCFMVYRKAWGQKAVELHKEVVELKAALIKAGIVGVLLLAMAVMAGAGDFNPDKTCAWKAKPEDCIKPSVKGSVVAGATPLVLDYGSTLYCLEKNSHCYETVKGWRAGVTVGTAVLFTGADYWMTKHGRGWVVPKWILRIGFWGYSLRNAWNNVKAARQRGGGE